MDTEKSTPKSLWKQLLSYLYEKPAVSGAVIYLYVSIVGVTYNIMLFGNFYIDILDYYTVADFLLSGLRQPILLLIFLFIPIFYLGAQYLGYRIGEPDQEKLERRLARIADQKNFFATINRNLTHYRLRFIRFGDRYKYVAYTGSLFVGLYGSVLFSSIEADEQYRYTTSLFANEICVYHKSSKQYISNLTLIGTTLDFYFFFHRPSKEVIIIPDSEISSLIFLKEASSKSSHSDKCDPPDGSSTRS